MLLQYKQLSSMTLAKIVVCTLQAILVPTITTTIVHTIIPTQKIKP